MVQSVIMFGPKVFINLKTYCKNVQYQLNSPVGKKQSEVSAYFVNSALKLQCHIVLFSYSLLL